MSCRLEKLFSYRNYMTMISGKVIKIIQFIEGTQLLETMHTIEAFQSREAMEVIEALQFAKTRYTGNKIDNMQFIKFLKLLDATWFIEVDIEANQTIESIQVIRVIKVI